MFHCMYPLGQGFSSISLLHRYHRLEDHRAAIQFRGDKMDAGTVLIDTAVQRALVGIQAAKRRQQ